MTGSLQRTVGLGGAVLLGLGSILGTGVFVSVGIVTDVAGPSVLLAIALAAVVACCNGLSSAQLAHVDRHLRENYVEPGKIPGCETLVFRRGALAHHSVLGQRDLERGTPATEDTIYRIYSMTKPITSVALMQLHEEGRVGLSDPVARYLPEFRDLGVYAQGVYPHYVTEPCERPMTVRDLLSHQSGLTYGFMARTNSFALRAYFFISRKTRNASDGVKRGARMLRAAAARLSFLDVLARPPHARTGQNRRG